MLNKKLTRYDNIRALRKMGFNIDQDAQGWVSCCNVLRGEKRPSFSVHVDKGICKDFTDEQYTTDLIGLVMKYLDIGKEEIVKALDFIGVAFDKEQKCGNMENFPNYWKNTARKDVFKWYQEKSNFSETPYIWDYDCISEATLRRFGCATFKGWKLHIDCVQEQSNKDASVMFPYLGGVQLYRRDKNGKIILSMIGSKPSASLFGSLKAPKGDKIYIMKSPREAMLLSQLVGDADAVLGLPSGEGNWNLTCLKTFVQHKTKGKEFTEIYVDADADKFGSAENLYYMSVFLKSVFNKNVVVRSVNFSKDADGIGDLTEYVQMFADYRDNGYAKKDLVQYLKDNKRDPKRVFNELGIGLGKAMSQSEHEATNYKFMLSKEGFEELNCILYEQSEVMR